MQAPRQRSEPFRRKFFSQPSLHNLNQTGHLTWLRLCKKTAVLSPTISSISLLHQVFHLYFCSRKEHSQKEEAEIEVCGSSAWMTATRLDRYIFVLFHVIMWYGKSYKEKQLKNQEHFVHFNCSAEGKVFFLDLCLFEYITSILDCNPSVMRSN